MEKSSPSTTSCGFCTLYALFLALLLSAAMRPHAQVVLFQTAQVRNLSMHINARSALEAAGFIPVLIRFLRRTDEFSEEEKGNVTKYVDERENVTLTVPLRSLLAPTPPPTQGTTFANNRYRGAENPQPSAQHDAQHL